MINSGVTQYSYIALILYENNYIKTALNSFLYVCSINSLGKATYSSNPSTTISFTVNDFLGICAC